jgi:hypothetical protein
MQSGFAGLANSLPICKFIPMKITLDFLRMPFRASGKARQNSHLNSGWPHA